MPESDSTNGWTRVAFGDVVQLCRERSSDPEGDGFERYVGLEHIEPGDLTIRRWGNIADGTTFTNVFRPGQVLFGKRRAYQRKVAVAHFDGVCSGDIYVLEPKNQRLLPELLPFVCQTDGFFEHAVGTSAGSLSPRTNWESLATYELALPQLQEQQRLATALRAMNDLVCALQAAWRQALLAGDALRAFLIAGGPDAGRRFKASELPARWQSIPLADLVHGRYGLVDGPFGSNLKSVHYRESGYPVLQSAFIAEGFFKADAAAWVYVDEEKFREQSRSAVRAGDIAMVKVGVNCGASALLPDDFPTSILAGNCLKITPDPMICSPRYLIHYLRWLRQVGYLERHVTSTQQRALTLGRLREQLVLLPPLEEQGVIVGHVESCLASVVELQKRSDEARAIMVKAREEFLRT